MTVETTEYTIPSVFAKEIGVTPQTVSKWIETADLKPIQTIGHVKLFVRSELEELRGKYGRNKADYIHPDKYKALEDLHRSAAVRLAEKELEYRDLLANYNTLMAEYNAMMDKQEEQLDESEREMNQLITGEALTDAEYDEKYPDMDDDNMLNVSE